MPHVCFVLHPRFQMLASYGLLAGHRVVVHHEAEPGFRETWPEIDVIDAIYRFDGPRLSSAGGTATGDATRR